MTNQTTIKEKLLSVGMTLGGYNPDMDKLSKRDLKKVIDNMEHGSGDVGITGKRVVEINHVDNEVDFGIITTAEYARRYGRIFQDNK